MSRGSSKPCPGCGKTDTWRSANKVCRNCEQLLSEAAEMREILEKLGPAEIEITIGKFDHWNKYIHSRARENGRALLNMLHTLVMYSSRPSVNFHGEFEILGTTEMGGRIFRVMSRPVAETIRDLRNLIAKSLSEEYEEGKEDGRNLLMSLAKGEIAPNDWMKEQE